MRWVYNDWLYLLCVLGIITLVISIMNWSSWDIPEKILALNALVLPFHVLEEWRLPGGFHYQYNLLFNKSRQPDRYPLSMKSDMLINLLAEILFMTLLIMGARKGFALAMLIFDSLEAIVHTILGTLAYKKYKSKGKKTIYGVGSVTAYLGQGGTAIYAALWCAKNTFNISDYIVCAVIIFILILIVFGIEKALKKYNNEYVYPSKGYFEKFAE